LSIDEEIAGIQDELEDIEKTLTTLFSLITQLDYEQEVINEEKRQEEIARIQMEDQMWY
jgi:cell division protein FtsB